MSCLPLALSFFLVLRDSSLALFLFFFYWFSVRNLQIVSLQPRRDISLFFG